MASGTPEVMKREWRSDIVGGEGRFASGCVGGPTEGRVMMPASDSFLRVFITLNIVAELELP